MLLSGFVVIWFTLRWQSWCEWTYPRSSIKNTNIGAQVAQKLKQRGSSPIEKCPFYIKIYLFIAETSLKQTTFREPVVSAIEEFHRIKICINRQYVRWFNKVRSLPLIEASRKFHQLWHKFYRNLFQIRFLIHWLCLVYRHLHELKVNNLHFRLMCSISSSEIPTPFEGAQGQQSSKVLVH